MLVLRVNRECIKAACLIGDEAGQRVAERGRTCSSAASLGAFRQQRQDLGDLGHVIPRHQQFEDLFRGLWRVAAAIRHLSQTRGFPHAGCADTVLAAN